MNPSPPAFVPGAQPLDDGPLPLDAVRVVVAPGGMAAPRGHYSHVALAGGLVFVSGQLPVAPDGALLHDAPFEVQARQVLANVEAALRAARSSVAQLAQVRVYITDIERWPEFNAIYAEWAGAARPARAVVPVPALSYGFMLEVEATAVAGLGRGAHTAP